MKEQNYWKRRVGRRSLVRGAAVGGFGLTTAALIGCSDEGEADSTGNGGDATATSEIAEPTATLVDQSGAVKGGTLNVHFGYDHTGLDPSTSRGGNDHHWLYSIFETLVNNGPDFSTQPGLAESWEVEDDLNIVFNLRTNSKFHDGSAVTAEDVKYTIERHKNPDTGSYAAGQVEPIETVEVVDDSTVRFTLNAPSASLFSVLGDRAGMVLPRAIVEAQGEQFNNNPVGSGPMRFVEHVVDASNTLARSEHYHVPDYPHLDGLVTEVVPTSSVQFANLRTGRADFAEIDPKDRNEARQTEGIEYVQWVSTAYTQINTNTALFPNNDVRLRKALTLGLNRQAFLDAIFFGEAELANGPITRASWAYPADFAPLEENLDEAKKLMAAAGYADGFEFSMVTVADETRTPMSELIKDQWARLGINVEIQARSSTEAGTEYREQRTPMYLVGFSGRPDPDPTIFENFHSRGGFNRVIYNEEYVPDDDQMALDAQIQAARETYDQDERKALYADVIRTIVNDGYGIFFTHATDAVGVKNGVGGFTPYGDGKYRFHEMWKNA